MRRVLTDVPQDQVPFQKSLLESDGFVVEVRPQENGLFKLIGTKSE
jgi:hypothetical protein